MIISYPKYAANLRRAFVIFLSGFLVNMTEPVWAQNVAPRADQEETNLQVLETQQVDLGDGIALRLFRLHATQMVIKNKGALDSLVRTDASFEK